MILKQKALQLLLTFLVFLAIFTPKSSNASHALGAELTYECIGNNEYRVRLTFYRDCAGTVSIGSISKSVDINSSCLSTTLNLSLQDPVEYGPPFDQYLQEYEIPIYCQESNCGNGSLPGIQEIVFEGTVTLPACNDYVLSYSEFARSGSIATILNPDDYDVYVEAFLNTVDAPCNSSPQFDAPARGILCLNESNTMIHTATDFDGDMLVYSLYTPLVDANNTVTYLGGYSANNPVNNSSFSFNNGSLEITPTEPKVTVMGVKVEEYRNGILVGTVMRDFQITVVNNCPINPTGAFDSELLPAFNLDNSAVICLDGEIQFEVTLDNLQPGPNYFLNIINIEDFPGATFVTEEDPNNPNSLIGTFTWTPDLSNNTSDQAIVFEAFNDNCPIVGYSNFTYTLVYHDIVVEPWLELIGVACNDSVEIVPNIEPYGPVSYEWQNGDTTETFWAVPGTYEVFVEDTFGCKGTDTYEVYVNNYPVADFTVEDFCLNESIQIEDLSINFAESGVTPLNLTDWTWDFGDGSETSSDQNPTHTYSEAGDYTVSLTLENENDCSDYAEVIVTVNPLTDFDAKAEVACIGSETQFVNNSQPQSGSVVSWDWDLGDAGETSAEAQPQYTYPTVGTYDVTLTATTDQGCENDTVIKAIVVDEATASFEYEIRPECGVEGFVLDFEDKNNSTNAAAYLWDFDGVTDTTFEPTYVTPNGFVENIRLVAYAYPGEGECSDTAWADTSVVWLTFDFDTINAGNVITPNGDPYNECLAPFWHESYKDCYRLRIWDRWGMFIYDSDDITNGHCWPGTDRKGQPVSNGTFFYVAEVNNYSRAGSVVVTK